MEEEVRKAMGVCDIAVQGKEQAGDLFLLSQTVRLSVRPPHLCLLAASHSEVKDFITIAVALRLEPIDSAASSSKVKN